MKYAIRKWKTLMFRAAGKFSIRSHRKDFFNAINGCYSGPAFYISTENRLWNFLFHNNIPLEGVLFEVEYPYTEEDDYTYDE